jgi:hypothetical protein
MIVDVRRETTNALLEILKMAGIPWMSSTSKNHAEN